jgi:DNA-binding transcriptional regulator YdaS (Cro superfamily)
VFTQMALLKAIKYCDRNQRKLAELIGENPDKISYWLNRAKQIPFHQAIAIEKVTNGLVSRYELAPYALNKIEHNINIPANDRTKLTLSQRGSIAIQLEKQFGNRRGVRRKCALKGKTSALVAQEAGFSSRDTYMRVKKVLQHGVPELIQAMNDRAISVSLAAKISALPSSEQKMLLQKSRKEILHSIINDQENLFMARIRTVKPELFRHEKLFEAEKKYKLPLRIAFVGLFTCCDREGRFRWKPKQLKLDVLPYDEVDMLDVLNALVDSGFIMHYQMEDEDYGLIPSWSKHQYFNHREAASALPSQQVVSEIVSEKGKEKKWTKEVLRIFAHWKSVMKHPKALLDEKREEIILHALKSGYTVSQLCEAISGCAKTPHNMGENEQGQRYDGVHIILRDADQIERFITNFHNPPTSINALAKLVKLRRDA